MQEQNGIENPIIFISQILSDQATRWSIMELELYAFVYSIKQLTPYLMGKLFPEKTYHKNLVFLVKKWSVGESSSDFLFNKFRVLIMSWQTDSLG